MKKLTQGHWPIFLLNSLSSMGNMLLPLILVRLLTPEEVGQYKIFYLYLMALPFLFMAGGPVYSVFFWFGKGKEESEKAINATWIWTLLLSFSIFIIGWPLKEFISQNIGLSVEHVIIMLIAGALWCPSGHYSESSIASGKHGRGALFSAFFELVKTLGFIFVAWRWHKISILFLFHPVLMLTKLALGSWLNSRENGISFRTDSSSMRNVFKYFFPVSLAGCLGFFVDKVDLLILSGVLDTSNFAFYSMGCLIVPPLFMLEMSVQKVLIPNLSKAHAEKDWTGGAGHFRKAVNDISYLILPAVMGLLTFAEPIVKLLYTEKYIDSASYLRVFAFSYLLLIFPHDSAARASGRTGWILKMYLIFTPVSLTLAYFSAKYWGAMGILIVGILLKSVPKIFGLHFSKKVMNWTWSAMFPFKNLANFMMLSLALSLVSVLVKGLFSNDMTWFYVCAPVFATIYLGVLNMVRQDPIPRQGNQKVVVLFAPGPIGGAEKVVVTGQRALLDKKTDIELWIINEARVPKVQEDFKLLAARVGVGYKEFPSNFIIDCALFLNLKRRLKTEIPAILHAHGMKAAVYGWLVCPSGTKLVITHHGKTSHTLKVRVYEFIERIVLRNAHAVIAVSGDMRRGLINEGMEEDRVFLIENLLALNVVPREFSLQNELRLVFVGRLSKEKGLDVLIRALAHFNHDFSLTVVGEGPERSDLQALVKCKGLEKKIDFVGFQFDIVPFLKGSDALVMPSLREGQPLALIEALCMGLPALASKVGGIPELVEDGINGYLFRAGDVDELLAKLEEFSQNRTGLTKSTSEIVNKMTKRFSPEAWAERTIESYQKVLIQS